MRVRASLCISLVALAASIFFIAPPAEASTLSQTKTLTLDAWISDIEVDPARPLAYLSAKDNNSVFVFSFVTLDIVEEIFVGSEPAGMDLDELTDRLYVALSGGPGIAVVDLANQVLDATWSVLGGTWDVAVGRPGRLYVTMGGGSWTIPKIINTSSGEIVADINALGNVRGSSILDISPDKDYLYIGERGISPVSLYKLDVRTDSPTLVAEDEHGSLGSNLRDMVLSPNGGVMYLACGSPYYIQVIDTDSITAAGKMDTGRGPSSVAVTPDGSIVLGGTTSSDDFYLHSFDSATFLKIDEFETTDETWRVAINADGEFILAFTGDAYYDTYYLDIYAHVYAQPPEGTIIEPLPNSVLSTADVPICVQLEDPDGVNSSSIAISVDAVDLETTWDAGTHRANALAANLTSGSHQIEAQAYDLKGHGPMVLQWSFSLDFEPPFVRILEPSTLDWIPDSRITIIWESGDTTSGIAGQKMRINSGDWISIGPNATQHAFTPTPEGHHNVTIQVEDYAGWVSEDSVHFKNDGSGPELLFTSPLDNPRLESGPVVVSWIASDSTSGLAGFAISVDNGSFVYEGLNTSFTVGDLGEGGHSFRVRAADWAGNVVESMTYVTIGSPESHIPTVIFILLIALLAIVVALCVAILMLVWHFKWRNTDGRKHQR